MEPFVRLTATIGNVPVDFAEDLLSRRLASAFPDIDVYEFTPPPNVVLASSLTWQAILGVTADVAGIASFIWMVWSAAQKHKPKGGPKRSGAILLIQLNPGDRKFRQLVVKESDLSEEAFVKKFAEAVASAMHDEGDQSKRLQSNPNWVKVRRHGGAN